MTLLAIILAVAALAPRGSAEPKKYHFLRIPTQASIGGGVEGMLNVRASQGQRLRG